ncbi:MAG: DUF4290 domain-containing protein [Prevotella sp.]|jgi:hypothetical protein|nr:DUF4290 domain-containing protein [Prevotella sp.]
MNIEGLDYNTQRERIKLNEYGREIQQMVDYCVSIPDREERQVCAEAIIDTMRKMNPSDQNVNDRMQTLWDHLALMSDFKLDIDYPVEITTAEQMASKPEPVAYPNTRIPVRHYGRALFELFETLKTMEPGEERDTLVRMTANQMKRCLLLWGHGNGDDEKVADDLARFTDGVIQLDLDSFRFDKIDVQSIAQQAKLKKQKKK